jgi:hypothetical protein
MARPSTSVTAFPMASAGGRGQATCFGASSGMANLRLTRAFDHDRLGKLIRHSPHWHLSVKARDWMRCASKKCSSLLRSCWVGPRRYQPRALTLRPRQSTSKSTRLRLGEAEWIDRRCSAGSNAKGDSS